MQAPKSGLIFIVVAALPLCPGCGGPFPTNARDRLIAANRQYESGNLTAARGELDTIIRDYPAAPQSAEAYYLRGLCHMRARESSLAGRDFERCVSLSRRPDLAAKAHAALGEIDFGLERYAAACEHFAIAASGLGNESPIDEVLYRYGVSLQREGRWDEARAQLARLLQQHGGGRHRDEVQRRVNWPANTFAIQCGVFREPKGADALVRKLSAAGISARQAVEGRAGESIRVVYAGKYGTRPQAKAALPGVRRIAPDAQVMP